MKTFAIQDDLNKVFAKHIEEIENLCDKLKEDQLSNLALDLKKSNYHLYHNFCQFNDIINIQNDNFHLTPSNFKPKQLMSSIIKEFQVLFDCNPVFEN